MIFYHKILQHLPLVTTIEGQGQEKLWSWNKINIYEKSEQKLQQTLESAYGQREGKSVLLMLNYSVVILRIQDEGCVGDDD